MGKRVIGFCLVLFLGRKILIVRYFLFMFFVEFMIMLGFCGYYLLNEVVFRVFFYGLGDFGVLNLFVWVNGILRYWIRVLFVFKIMVFLRIGL